MIKSLRITGIIVAIAATVLLILPAVYGVRSDPKIEDFIKSPGVVDKFTNAKGQNAAPKNTESPLVKVASGFGQILNPPPPPPPKAPPVGSPQAAAAAPAPPVVAVKFDLVATSYYASHPEQSFVLIDEPGKGLHWVKQGSAVGHLTIETVKDGAIVVRDGQRTSEMAVKSVQEPYKKLLKNSASSASPSPSSVPSAGSSPVQPSPVTTDKPAASIPARTGTPAMPGRINPRARTMPQLTDRITSAAQPAPQITQPATAANSPTQPAQPTAPTIAQPAPAEPAKTPSAAEITPPPEEKPPPEDSPAIKEKAAKIDKLLSETGTSGEITPEEQKKLDEVFKQIEELGKMRDEESAKDVNAKDVNK